MAEFVQQSIEEMLPELEQMERIQLFTPKETRAILKKRRTFEYRLRRKTKEKDDYLNYVQYEMNVLSLVRKRRDRLGIKYKIEEIDVQIIQRIHRLFRLVQFRFQDDVKLWLSHIDFSKTRQEKASVSKLYTRMLQVHNRKPELWVAAAGWEIEFNASMETARALLQRGLRFNPESKYLWREYFRMELMNVDQILKRKEILGLVDMEMDEENPASDAVLEGVVARIVFKQAQENFPDDVEFLLSFLTICQPFSFTSKIEDEIFTKISERHHQDELVQEALACRCLSVLKSSQVSSLPKKERVNRIGEVESECWSHFDEAVDSLPTEKMWTLYIQNCLRRLKEKGSRKLSEKRLMKISDVFSRAANNATLSEDMSAEWLTFLEKTGQVRKLIEAADKVITLHEKSALVWYKSLSIHMRFTQDKQVHNMQRLISNCVQLVPQKDSLEIWKLAVEWYLINDADNIEDLFERGLLIHEDVSIQVKKWYLEWSVMHQDNHKTKQLYKRLSITKPLSIDFFQTYINIAMTKPKIRTKEIRRIFEECLSEFGANNAELWINYIKFEQEHGRPELIGQLNWRAMKQLEGHLVQDYITKYSLIKFKS